MNYYPFHLGDYAAHTRHLSLMEDLAYRRMLDLYYTSEQPLPLDPEKVARLIGMRDQMREVSDVLSDFFLKSEAGHINPRCDREIEMYQAKANRAKSANQARWEGKKSDPLLKSESDQIPTKNQEPRTKNHKPKKEPTSPPVGDADLFPGVDAQVVSDFKALRKQKKSAITKTAMDRIASEAEKANISLEAALRICCTRGWQGFQADWVLRDSGQRRQSTLNDIGGPGATDDPFDTLRRA